MLDSDIVTREPLNAETSWRGLRESTTPASEFFKRNHGSIPRIDARTWRLELEGFERPFSLDLASLRSRGATTLDVVLECAGNGRTFFEPTPEGTPWRERAVACASFTGAPLGPVLQEAGVPAGALEIHALGADEGKVPFERSLPLDVALAPDTLLAWEMNGEPLSAEHGAPARLVVPSWYGVASVKWLARLRPLDAPFEGYFQKARYTYERAPNDPRARPVREKRVNSLVVTPAPGERATPGEPLRVSGWAWSGAGPIVRVEVSTDGGRSWRDAKLGGQRGEHGWCGWHLDTVPAGEPLAILSVAHDAAGNAQPDKPEWNVHGYGYNAPRPRAVLPK